MENIFFNGGGFSGFFEHVGAINYIRENNLTFNKYYGVSAGVSAIIMLLLEYDIDDFISFLDNICEEQTWGKKIDISDTYKIIITALFFLSSYAFMFLNPYNILNYIYD